jgi:hypothetical protein
MFFYPEICHILDGAYSQVLTLENISIENISIENVSKEQLRNM